MVPDWRFPMGGGGFQGFHASLLVISALGEDVLDRELYTVGSTIGKLFSCHEVPVDKWSMTSRLMRQYFDIRDLPWF